MNKIFISSLLLLFSSCYRVKNTIDPQFTPLVSEKYLQALPSPFPPLLPSEETQDWGREEKIALRFARDLDLYSAKTTFRRAFYLLPPNKTEKALEVSYNILLCYYLGEKHHDVIYTFDKGPLQLVIPSFAPYHDLLVALYDSCDKQSDYRSYRFFNQIQKNYPETAQKLQYYKLLSTGDIAGLAEVAESSPPITDLLKFYKRNKKSTGVAQMLNTIIPGMGYLYIGQKQSAITSFFLNALFISASAYAFHQGNVAAGVILAGFEAGWYFGGIYGAGLGAKLYNERVYEKAATPIMNQNGYFPILMLKYGF